MSKNCASGSLPIWQSEMRIRLATPGMQKAKTSCAKSSTPDRHCLYRYFGDATPALIGPYLFALHPAAETVRRSALVVDLGRNRKIFEAGQMSAPRAAAASRAAAGTRVPPSPAHPPCGSAWPLVARQTPAALAPHLHSWPADRHVAP